MNIFRSCMVSLLPVLLLLAPLEQSFAAKGGKPGSGGVTGLVSIGASVWTETAVRKVLHTFAYGGLTSDAQIQIWAAMQPADAINEILTFDPVNSFLSPAEDASSAHGGTLRELQEFWSSDLPDNPVPPNLRSRYSLLIENSMGIVQYGSGLQRNWMQAVNIRGVNPFLHHVGLYLTNYQMAISMNKVRSILMRDYYDNMMISLSSGKPFVELIGQAATSAAISLNYGHQSSRMDASTGVIRFIGNDDFAREFHQLFFRIQGETEDKDYHENVTIENTARLLSGMQLDVDDDAYGDNVGVEWVPPIVFTDHIDPAGRTVNNITNHLTNDPIFSEDLICTEVLNFGANPRKAKNICGGTAEEKIFALAEVAGQHEESLDNIPVTIIDFFADDNLTLEKKTAIQSEWRSLQKLKSRNNDLLLFLRAYAISTTFHSPDTVKFRSAFDRNLTVQNMAILTNEESFVRVIQQSLGPRMGRQGALVFVPAHDVFGGQTGLQAANNPNIFKDAYKANVEFPFFLGEPHRWYTDANGDDVLWSKDWGSVIPTNANGEHVVGDMARWLWDRFVADGGKNYDAIAQAQLQSILATGQDFGLAVALDPDPNTSTDPNQTYSSAEITDLGGVLNAINNRHAETVITLNNASGTPVRTENLRIGLAVNFLAVTPYMFALEGN